MLLSASKLLIVSFYTIVRKIRCVVMIAAKYHGKWNIIRWKNVTLSTPPSTVEHDMLTDIAYLMKTLLLNGSTIETPDILPWACRGIVSTWRVRNYLTIAQCRAGSSDNHPSRVRNVEIFVSFRSVGDVFICALYMQKARR